MNIKFRVWCKDFNEWEKDTILLTPSGQKVHLDRHNRIVSIKPENHIVMLYTGLKDGNGQEIYEGDIVDYYTESEHDTLEGRAEVIYENCSFMIDEWWLGVFEDKAIEVIGNIYENPELLKERNAE